MVDERFKPIPWDKPLPQHLAIIMDGNGRWATERGMPRVEGHKAGAQTVRKIVRTCRRLGIPALTLYAFSAQNWKRPVKEVSALMSLLKDYVLGERGEILDNNIRFNCIGDIERLPFLARGPLKELIRLSAKNTGMVLTLALSYGGREEIVQASKKLAEDVAAGRIRPEAINEEALSQRLWARQELGEVDLLIRTSGEYRVSNFLLWQIAYAEFWFTDLYWPDFGAEQLFEALRSFGGRQRRFGEVRQPAQA